MWTLLCAAALAAAEVPYDGLDQDGDGKDLVDVDGDGIPSELAFGGDCNDRDPRVHPAAPDPPGDGVDADCDGVDGRVPRGCGGSYALLAVPGLLARFRGRPSAGSRRGRSPPTAP